MKTAKEFVLEMYPHARVEKNKYGFYIITVFEIIQSFSPFDGTIYYDKRNFTLASSGKNWEDMWELARIKIYEKMLKKFEAE